MGKQRSWWSKIIFLCRSSGEEEEDKKKQFHYSDYNQKERILIVEEAKEKQRKYAIQVAKSTAAAAEAAVTAAHAAAQILRITLTVDDDDDKQMIQIEASSSSSAAIKIQTAFRRYLARKALVALKGVVKLQAIIRGQSVRRLFLISPPFNQYSIYHPIHFTNKVLVGSKSQRKWEDYNILSNEHVQKKTLCSRKQTDRIFKYSFSHRERTNTNSFMVEQQESVLPKRPETASHCHCQDLQYINKQPHLFVRTSSSQDDQARLYSFPRRSFCRTRPNSTPDEDFVPNSPVFPTYMAATESAKAKARSVSTPRQRLLTQLNGLSPRSSSYNDVSQFSPYSCKLKSPLLA